MTNLVTVRLSTNTFEALEYSRAFFCRLALGGGALNYIFKFKNLP
jgi:hypothetical protein